VLLSNRGQGESSWDSAFHLTRVAQRSLLTHQRSSKEYPDDRPKRPCERLCNRESKRTGGADHCAACHAKILPSPQLSTDQNKAFIAELEVLEQAVIEWRVTNTTKSGNLRGQGIPYADAGACCEAAVQETNLVGVFHCGRV